MAATISTGTPFPGEQNPWDRLTPDQQQAYRSWSMGRGATTDQGMNGLRDWQAAGMPSTYGQTLGGMAQQPGYAGMRDEFKNYLSGLTPEQRQAYLGQDADKMSTAQGASTQQGGGLPPWVTPDQAQFYNTLNQGWMQGHGGQPIPQERFQYLQGAYNDEAAQGANGSHVGDMNWWQNRASIDRGPDPGEAGYVPGQGGQMGGGFSPNAQNGVASFNAPGLLAPYTKEFQPTDITTILNAPAYQAAQANGVDQIQRSAAGRGTLLTGGTLKDLAGYTQGLALGELNNQFNRDATTFGTNRDTFYGNQNNAFNKLSSFANTGANIASSLGQYGSSYANNAQQNANQSGDLLTGQGDATATNDINKGLNKGQTIGNLATNLGQVDWSKLFRRGTATI